MNALATLCPSGISARAATTSPSIASASPVATLRRQTATLSAASRTITGDPAAAVSPGRATEIGRATSELQSLMRISYAVFCLKKKKNTHTKNTERYTNAKNTQRDHNKIH